MVIVVSGAKVKKGCDGMSGKIMRMIKKRKRRFYDRKKRALWLYTASQSDRSQWNTRRFESWPDVLIFNASKGFFPTRKAKNTHSKN